MGKASRTKRERRQASDQAHAPDPGPGVRFREMGIASFHPGFYEDNAFVLAEQLDPSLLETYADYVNGLAFTDDYLGRASVVIKDLAHFVHRNLLLDGRLSLCEQVSSVLGKLLEQVGIWNYVVKGGFNIHFDANTGLAPTYFYPFQRTGDLAHAWLCAPPYKILDITLKRQPYRGAHVDYLPDTVFGTTESLVPKPPQISDIVEPPIIGRPPIDDSLRLRIQKYGSFELVCGPARLKYVGCAISAFSEPWTELTGPCLDGKSAQQLLMDWRKESTNLTEVRI